MLILGVNEWHNKHICNKKHYLPMTVKFNRLSRLGELRKSTRHL